MALERPIIVAGPITVFYYMKKYQNNFILMYQNICQADKRCNYQNIRVKGRLSDLQVKKSCGLLLIKAYELIFPWLIGFTLRIRIDDH